MEINREGLGLSKFIHDEPVIYQNGDVFEIGIVTDVIMERKAKRQHQRQDGLHGEPSGPVVMVDSYVYRVRYNSGSTTALTDERSLHKITNIYAFDITIKKENDKNE